MTRPGRSRSIWSPPTPSSCTSSRCRSRTRFHLPSRTRSRREAGVPGTGPYMLEAPMTDEGLALVRNPHFHVWSPAAQPDGYVDRIEWTFGVEPQAQVEAVASRRRGPRVRSDCFGQARGNLRAVRGAGPYVSGRATYFVVLNTDGAALRRPRGAAGDEPRNGPGAGRAGLRRRGAAIPTCQQLPPNFPGYEPYCPYTMDPGPEGEGSWTAPDLEEAEETRPPFGHGRDAGRVSSTHRLSGMMPGVDPGGVHRRAARRARIPRERERRCRPVTSTAPPTSSRWRSTHGAPTTRPPRTSSSTSFTCDASLTPHRGTATRGSMR